jgi:fibronectin-binding autotransporter adhesin
LAGDIYDNLYNSGDGLAILKSGPGTWFLQGVKHQKGTVTVQQGTLLYDSIGNIGTNSALGQGSKAINSAVNSSLLVYQIGLGNGATSAGTLQYAGAVSNSTARVFGLLGSGAISSGTNGGFLVLNGAITNVLTNVSCVLTLAGGNTNTVAGGIYDGAGQTSLIVSNAGPSILTNAGAWALTAANTLSGSTEPAAGILFLSNSLALQNSALDLESGDTGFVDFTTLTSLTLGALESGVFQAGGRNLTLTNDAGTALPLVLTKNDGNTYSYSGILSGGTTLIKTGNSTQSVGGLAFSGNTTISNGELMLLAGGSISSPVIAVASGATFDVSQLNNGLTLNSGQTLTGVGAVNGSVTTSSGSVLSVGANTSGTLTIGNLSLTGHATNQVNLGSSTSASVNAFINVPGNLSLSGNNTIVINDYLGSLVNGTYPLIQYGSLNSGGLANLTLSPAIPGYSLTLTNVTSSYPNYIGVVVLGVHIPANLVWQGNNPNDNWDVETTSNWLNGASLVAFYQGDSVTFNDNSANDSLNVATAVAPANLEVNNTAHNYTLAGSGLLTGSTALKKDGTGTLTILTTDNNVGGTTIDSGTIQVGNGGTSGWLGSGSIADNGALIIDLSGSNALSEISGSGSLTQEGGVLSLASGASGFSGNVTVSAGGMMVVFNEAGLGAGNQVTLGGGGVIQTTETSADSFNRNVVLAAGGGGFNHAIDLTINGAITGAGPLILEGAGQSIIPNGQSYAGGTMLNGGSLAIDSVSALGTNALTIDGGTLFRANGGEQLTMTIPVNLATNLILGNAGDQGLTFTNGAWTLQGTAAASWLLSNNTPVEIDSPIGQSIAGMGLTVQAAQPVILTGSNTFTGPLMIVAGQVTVTGFGLGGEPSPVGAGTNAPWPPSGTNISASIGLISNSGPILQYVGPGETTDKALYVSPQDGKFCTLDASGAGALVFTNTTTNIFAYIQNATAGNGTLILTGTNTNANTLAGDIYDNLFNGSDGLALAKSNTGTWYLQGVKHNQGRLDVQNGLLMFDSISNIGTACSLGTAANVYNSSTALSYQITLGAAATSGTLQYTGAATNSTTRAFGLLGSGTISSGYNGGSLVLNGFITNTTSGNTLTLSGAGAGSAIGGVIYDGPGGLSLNIGQTGDTGSWTLSDANTYSGGTTVNSGELLVNNTTGSGTGSGPVQVNSPGEFGGTGAISGSVMYSDGTLANFTVGSPMKISGSLSINGNTVVHVQLPPNFTGGSNVLAYVTGGISGAFAATPVIDSGFLGAHGSATVTTANGIVSLVATVSPGPTPPTFRNISQSGTNLVLTGTGGLGSGTYYVLMNTNLAVTNLSLWTVVATNTYGPNGGFTNTLPVTPGQPDEYFLLETPE